MTCAVAEAIMNGGQKDNFIDAMKKKYGRMYPNADYGARFNRWLMTDNRDPYNSFGNGSAMRVSPCAWFVDATTEELPAEGNVLPTFCRGDAQPSRRNQRSYGNGGCDLYVPLLLWWLC